MRYGQTSVGEVACEIDEGVVFVATGSDDTDDANARAIGESEVSAVAACLG